MYKYILLGVLLCLVAAKLEEESCEDTHGPTPPYDEDAPYFPYIESLFLKENVTEFTDEIYRQLVDDVDDDELASMAESMASGSLPEYVKDRGFELLENLTGKYGHSERDYATSNIMIYGLLEEKDMQGNYSSIVFTLAEGETRSKPYKTTSCFYSRVQYVIEDATVYWIAFTNGVFLYRLPMEQYYVYGSYGGYTQAEIQLLGGSNLEFLGFTMGALNNMQFPSKTVTNLAGMSTLSNFSYTYDMISLTGGTNATMTCFGKVDPESPEIINSFNGTLSNYGLNISVRFQSKGYQRRDSEVLFFQYKPAEYLSHHVYKYWSLSTSMNKYNIAINSSHQIDTKLQSSNIQG